LEGARPDGRQHVDRLYIHHAETGIDVRQLRRALIEAHDRSRVDVDIADRHTRVNRETVAVMLAHESIVVETTQHVSVSDREASAEKRACLAQRTARTEGLALPAIRDLDSET